MKNGLKLIEQDGLIKVYQTDTGEYVVDGRELWQGLGSKQDFSTWVKKRLSSCDAVEGDDYTTLHKKMERQVLIEYIIKLDTAKEMALMENNSVGKQYRKYFIEVEKKYKEVVQAPQPTYNLPQTYLEALEALVASEKEKLALQAKVEEDAPKVEYHDNVLQSKSTFNISQIAFEFGISGVRLNKILHEQHIQYKQGGQWLLYEEHKGKGYTEVVTVTYPDGDGFGTNHRTKWTETGRKFIHEVMVELGYKVVNELAEAEE